MTTYHCECCHFSSKLKSDYTRHLNTKKHQKLAEISKSLAEISQSPKTFECEYCHKKYKHKSSLCKHIKNSCLKKKESDKIQEMMEMFDEHKKEVAELKENNIVLQQQIKEMSNANAQNVNNGNINNGTINNNNINVVLNSFDKPDISHLKDEDFREVAYLVNDCIPKLIEKIHFDPEKPENHNVHIKNLNTKYTMVHKDGAWGLCLTDDVTDLCMIRYFGYMEDWFSNGDKKGSRVRKC